MKTSKIIIKTNDGDFRVPQIGFEDTSKLAGWGRVWDFTKNLSSLRASHPAVLQEIGGFLKSHPGHFCRINGLASRSGSNEFNLQLSDKRARNVHGFLTVRSSVEADQLTHRNGRPFFAFGEEPYHVIKANGPEENSFHRCVVLTVWKDNNPTLPEEMKVLRFILANAERL